MSLCHHHSLLTLLNMSWFNHVGVWSSVLKHIFSLVPLLSPRQLANEMYGLIKTIVFFWFRKPTLHLLCKNSPNQLSQHIKSQSVLIKSFNCLLVYDALCIKQASEEIFPRNLLYSCKQMELRTLACYCRVLCVATQVITATRLYRGVTGQQISVCESDGVKMAEMRTVTSGLQYWSAVLCIFCEWPRKGNELWKLFFPRY